MCQIISGNLWSIQSFFVCTCGILSLHAEGHLGKGSEASRACAKQFLFPEFTVDRSFGVCAAIIRLCRASRYARDCAKFFCKRRCITLNIVAKNLYYPLSPRSKLLCSACHSHSVVIPRWILLPPQFELLNVNRQCCQKKNVSRQFGWLVRIVAGSWRSTAG